MQPTETQSGLNQPENPKHGVKDVKSSRQEWPGSDNDLATKADHGETSYVGAGKLKGKKALITGGDSGIGRAIAIAFAREGADVAIAYYDEHDDANETIRWVTEAGRKAFAYPGDLQDPETCQATVSRAVEALGGLDILVNNAAFQHEIESFEDLKVEDVERTFRTNFFAYIWMAQAALKYMNEGSVILNTGSVNALKGNFSLLDYSATKASIHNFTLSLAPELAKRGIRINCVAPGPVWTPLIASTIDPKDFGKNTHWERPAQPIEIATSYVFLASTDGRFYTGGVLSPTGTEFTSR